MSKPCRVAQFFGESDGAPRILIELEGVWVRLDSQTVLEDISFSLREHMFLGVIGPNGAGKTTLLRTVLGLVKPERGTIEVLGMEPRELKKELHHIGYMSQTVSFDPYFPVSVYDVVMMGRVCCIGSFRFPSRDDRRAVMESIDMVGLGGLEKKPIGELSGGQQKRAFLARALCRETHILLLDEPTAGLDLPAQDSFMELLTRFKNEMRLSVIFVSHDVSVLARHADLLVCVNRTMHLHGSPEEVLGSDRLQEAYRCEFDFLVGSGISSVPAGGNGPLFSSPAGEEGPGEGRC